MYADLKKNEHLRRRFGSLKALIGEGSRIYPFGDVVFVSTVGNDNFDLVIEADGEHTFLQLYEDYRKRVPIVVDEIGKSVYKVGERIYMLNATGGGGGGMTPEEVQEMIRALIVNLFADAEYNTASREINFLNGDGETVATIDATNFIKDGMVQSVAIVNGNLVITFNTDSGQQPISIPLTDIFDPENYYSKEDIDEILASDYYNKRNVDTKFAASDMRMSEKNVTVSTASAPSSSTLTYVSKTGETMNHIIGDKRIVPNAESSTGYDIYFLADIVEGEAKWIQGGGGDDLNEKIHINLTSNQPGDTTLYGVRVKVETEGGDTLLDTTWQGQQLSCRVAPLIRYTVSVGSVQDYYLEAGEQEYMSAIGDIREVTFAYSTTVVTFLPTSNQGAGDTDIESATGSINGTAVAYGGSRKVATGSQVTVVADALAEYVAPAQWTGTASGASLRPVMLYQKVMMLKGYIILDQTSADPTKKVIDEKGNTYSNFQRPAVIDAIRAASHCYVVTSFTNNILSLKQLDDTDGTKYADGTSAASAIASSLARVFMRLPFFFTRVSTAATDKIKIEFAFDTNQTVSATAYPAGSGWKQWGGNDLIGKYEAYDTNDKLFSISGVESTGTVSQAKFKAHARALGTGFTIVKWRHQNIMAILFYAYYGHTNCQQLIGSGYAGYYGNNRKTGLKNSLGMTDTDASNGNADNTVFWGLENWWGGKYEFVDNVVVDRGTWTITEDDGTTRTLTAGTHVMTAESSWVYPSKFYIGDYLDVVGAVGQTGGSDSTGYCDGQFINKTSSSRVVARSYKNDEAYGGVAFVYASYDDNTTSASVGSRLAFSGEIEIV